MPVAASHRPSTGFEAMEASILAVKPTAPKSLNLHAGEAGGRGGRVMRREDSVSASGALAGQTMGPHCDDKEGGE